MNTLTIIPDTSAVQFALLKGDAICARRTIPYSDFGKTGDDKQAEHSIGNFVQQNVQRNLGVIACRVPAGAAEFTQPVIADRENRRRLAELAPMAPMHIPAILSLLEVCDNLFPNTPSVLVFETAFFVDLPKREHLYAINLAEQLMHGIRRFGYHGLFHETAVRLVHAERQHGARDPDSLRTVSICLERRPEVAGVRGFRAMVTSGGATPLEGIPGERTCGQIDPGIPTVLAERLQWAPERINELLTRQSGLFGLLGYAVTMGEILGEQASHAPPEKRLAHELISYCLLRHAGMAAAALGGVDALVISGRYCNQGEKVARQILSSLLAPGNQPPEAASVHILNRPIELIIADDAKPLVR